MQCRAVPHNTNICSSVTTPLVTSSVLEVICVTVTLKSTPLCHGTCHNCSELLCHLPQTLCTALSLVTIDLHSVSGLFLVTIALSSLSLPSEWHLPQIRQHLTDYVNTIYLLK